MFAAFSRLADDHCTKTAVHYVLVAGLYLVIIVAAVSIVAIEL